jgi:hypothetical protein
LFERPSVFVELLVYLGLGVIWAIPLKAVFKGVGREDPDAVPSRPESAPHDADRGGS